jgi:hypothetical protein
MVAPSSPIFSFLGSWFADQQIYEGAQQSSSVLETSNEEGSFGEGQAGCLIDPECLLGANAIGCPAEAVAETVFEEPNGSVCFTEGLPGCPVEEVVVFRADPVATDLIEGATDGGGSVGESVENILEEENEVVCFVRGQPGCLMEEVVESGDAPPLVSVDTDLIEEAINEMGSVEESVETSLEGENEDIGLVRGQEEGLVEEVVGSGDAPPLVDTGTAVISNFSFEETIQGGLIGLRNRVANVTSEFFKWRTYTPIQQELTVAVALVGVVGGACCALDYGNKGVRCLRRGDTGLGLCYLGGVLIAGGVSTVSWTYLR